MSAEGERLFELARLATSHDLADRERAATALAAMPAELARALLIGALLHIGDGREA